MTAATLWTLAHQTRKKNEVKKEIQKKNDSNAATSLNYGIGSSPSWFEPKVYVTLKLVAQCIMENTIDCFLLYQNSKLAIGCNFFLRIEVRLH